MRFKLQKLIQLSGSKASIYSIFIEEHQKTSFDLFLEENQNLFKNELKDIIGRLKVIGHKTGAQDYFFKLKEGSPGDGVCALYDKPNSNLRLYCIRYGSDLIVIGGGGEKAKTIRALQENPKLKAENYFLRELSKAIKQKMSDKELGFSADNMDFEGDVNFNFD